MTTNTPTPEPPKLPTYEELAEQLATCQARWQHEVALRRVNEKAEDEQRSD